MLPLAGTTLYDGAYQYVNLDSGATAAYATGGMAAFILLDQGGPIEGTLPETAYQVPTVTTADVAVALYGSVAAANAFFCGVFINPATVAGQANGPTPGNWTMIFAGGWTRDGQCWLGGERCSWQCSLPRHQPSRQV